MRTKKGAIIASFAGMAAWIIVASLANYLFVLDFYLELYFHGDIDLLLNLLTVIPGITAENYMTKYILYAIIPFNVLLSGLVYLITFLVYKRISHLIDIFAAKLEKK